MAIELFPTPSWPRPAFSMPFIAEQKKFPHLDEMAEYSLSRADFSSSGDGMNITTFWACDYDNLYLVVELPASVNTSQNRAWRYGDGMMLTVSHQTACKPVERYTTIGIAGTTRKPQITVVKRGSVWFPKLDCSKVRYKLEAGSDKSLLYSTIPWSVLQPLRPLLYETIAINLTFVHQLPKGRAFYQLISDENFDTETTNLRRLLPVEISFAKLTRAIAQSFITRNCWRGADPLQINLGLFNPETCPARIDIAVKSGTDTLEKHSSAVELAAGCHHWTLKWSPQRHLPTGEYVLEVSGEGCGKTYKKQHNIYVVNPEELALVRADLQKLEEDIKCLYPGAVQTALAGLEWMEEELDKCPWDQADLSKYTQAVETLNSLRNGNNPLPDKPGLSRRAFRSTVDGSLQPYSLYLPKSFSAEHKWPLLMMLHGSGVDEQGMAANPELHKLADKLGVILLFPKARTASGFYLNQDETDILENLAIIKKRLPLDWDKLFLSGFSMGGFGAWHIGLRHPGHFSGLAIISGVPCLPCAGEDFGIACRFNPADYADNAKKLSLLVIHGSKDCAVPPEPVREVINALKDRGIQPVYKELSGGHGDFDWYSELTAWLKPQLKKYSGN